MHSYRTEGWNRKRATPWMQFTGLISTGHGPQQPIAVTYLDKRHPITEPLGDWTTVDEELYNNAAGRLEPTAHALARGVQGKAEWIVAWTNTYNDKTTVFGTTLGHNNETVADPRYLDLVTRGLLWSLDKLDDRYLRSAADLVREDLAKGKPATASSTQSPDHHPGAAVDGNPETRWCADGDSAPQWWQVDLGKPQDLTGIRIVWEQDGVNYRYKVEGSEDAKSWTTLADQTNSDAREPRTARTISWPGASASMRITATKLQPGAWASIFEVQVFGTERVHAPAGAAALPRPLKRAGPDGLLGEVRIPDGFRATLFARPPDVRYPTCLAAAPTGEVFVGVDENGSLDAKPGRGRVVRCIDKDDDGRADSINDFVVVDSPRGLIWDDGTLYVLHPPELTAYHDDDGDGAADRSETLVKGIGFDLKFRGADHTTNGIRLGIDGYIYIAVGDYGFIKAAGKDGATLQYRGGGVVRVRTDGTGLEPVSRGQRNIYDVAIDPYVNLFTRDNTNDGDGWDVRLSHVGADRTPGLSVAVQELRRRDRPAAGRLRRRIADRVAVPPGAGAPRTLRRCPLHLRVGPRGRLPPPARADGCRVQGRSGAVRHAAPTDRHRRRRPVADLCLLLARGHVHLRRPQHVGAYVIPRDRPGRGGPRPDLRAATDAQLIECLAAPGQVLRLAAQRAILRDCGSRSPAFAR